MYCEKCKKNYASDERFCAECGSKLVDELDVYAKELLNKDESAFDRIYNNTKTWVSRYVSMHLGNQDDCMDCTQEIYFKLFNKIDLFRPENGKFRPWFNTLVKNQVIDFARKNSKDVLIDDEEVFESIVDPEPIAEIEMERKESARLLNEILDALPEEQKICIKGFYFEGKKRKEIAELLGLSEETIKSRLRLAKEKIEAKVLDLERMQGTRIYGLSPFVFFLFLGAQERTERMDFALLQRRILKQKEIAEQVVRDVRYMQNAGEKGVETAKTSTINASAATVGKGISTATGKAIFHKTVIMLLTIVIIGGGGFAGYKIYNKWQSDKQKLMMENQEKELKSEADVESEKDEKKDLQEISETLNLESLKGILQNYNNMQKSVEEGYIDAESRFDSIMWSIAYDLYGGFEPEIWKDMVSAFASLKNEIVSGTNKSGYTFYEGAEETNEYNIVFKRDKVEELYCLVENGEPNLEALWKDNDSVIVNESEIAFCMEGIGGDIPIELIQNMQVNLNEQKNQIEVSYTYSYEYYDESYQESKCAVIVPVDNGLGYTILSNEVRKEGLTDIEVAYNDVLNKYAMMIQEEWDVEKILDEKLSDLYVYEEDDLGYALLDINGDGIRELFIGNVNGADKGFFYEAYTIQDGESVLITQSMYRNSKYLCENYEIENPLSGGIDVEGSSYYRLEKGNTELTFIEDAESNLYTHYSFMFEPIPQVKEDEKEFVDNTMVQSQEVLSVKEREKIKVADVEEKSVRLETSIENTSSQSELNTYSSQFYELWDDELNRLWKVLKKELDTSTMDELLLEQREWIKNKENSMAEAGKLIEEGSAEIMNKNMEGGNLTRTRVYELLEYLK